MMDLEVCCHRVRNKTLPRFGPRSTSIDSALWSFRTRRASETPHTLEPRGLLAWRLLLLWSFGLMNQVHRHATLMFPAQYSYRHKNDCSHTKWPKSADYVDFVSPNHVEHHQHTRLTLVLLGKRTMKESLIGLALIQPHLQHHMANPPKQNTDARYTRETMLGTSGYSRAREDSDCFGYAL